MRIVNVRVEIWSSICDRPVRVSVMATGGHWVESDVTAPSVLEPPSHGITISASP
jgi:hypothetical protein